MFVNALLTKSEHFSLLKKLASIDPSFSFKLSFDCSSSIVRNGNDKDLATKNDATNLIVHFKKKKNYFMLMKQNT